MSSCWWDLEYEMNNDIRMAITRKLWVYIVGVEPLLEFIGGVVIVRREMTEKKIIRWQ